MFVLDGGDIGPDLIQPLPNEAKQHTHLLAHAAQRTMACKGVYSVIAEADSLKECLEHIQSLDQNLSDVIDDTWCFSFFQMGKGDRFAPNVRRKIVEGFGTVMPSLHNQPVDLKNPVHEFVYVEDHRRPNGVAAIDKAHKATHFWLLYKHKPPENVSHIREWEETLALDARPFISPTSMEPARALQLVNMGLGGFGEGKSMVDPFCGSASLLLAASALGARCVGSDKLKYLLLRHKRVLPIPPSRHRPNRGVEKVSLYDNFAELGLPEPSIIPSLDAFGEDTAQQLIEANNGEMFDAMVTDPPYGIRASMEVDEPTLFGNVLELARKLLKPNGKLVFLFPQDPPDGQHFLYALAKEYGFAVQSLGWERFQQRQMRMIAVLQTV